MFFGADNDDFWEWRDGGDDSGGEFDSSVDFINFEDVVSGIVSAINEGLHVMVNFLSAEVDLNEKRVTLAAKRRRMSVDCLSELICHKIY